MPDTHTDPLSPPNESAEAALARVQKSLYDYLAAPSIEKTPQLQQTIDFYEALLQGHTQETLPADWGMVQNDLGMAYASLPSDEAETNQKRAIACYEAALSARPVHAFPTAWAMLQNNLASAYFELVTGNRGANLQQAIAYYKNALRIKTEQTSPTEWLCCRTIWASPMRVFLPAIERSI